MKAIGKLLSVHNHKPKRYVGSNATIPLKRIGCYYFIPILNYYSVDECEKI